MLFLYSVWDTEQPGLFLRVNPKGSITFFLFYRVDGKANDYALGRWGKITLAQARELARQKSGEVAAGNDVQASRKAAKAEASRAKQEQEKARRQTLRVFLDEVYEPWVKQNRRGAVDTLYRIRHGAADRMLTVQGSGSKSGETRHVPLNDEAVDALTRWKE